MLILRRQLQGRGRVAHTGYPFQRRAGSVFLETGNIPRAQSALGLATILLAALFLSVSAPAWADESAESELAQVRARLSKLQEELQSQTKALKKERHQLEYQDAEISSLYQETKALEKELVEKRRLLEARLNGSKEIQKLNKAREKLVQELHELRQDEQRIRSSLAEEQANATGLSP